VSRAANCESNRIYTNIALFATNRTLILHIRFDSFGALNPTRPLTHLQFRTELYCKLLGYSKEAKLRSLQLGLGGKRVFNPDLQHLHY
jgi:hypothetical protein